MIGAETGPRWRRSELAGRGHGFGRADLRRGDEGHGGASPLAGRRQFHDAAHAGDDAQGRGLRRQDGQRRRRRPGQGPRGAAARADPDRLRDARAGRRRALQGDQDGQGAAHDPRAHADDPGRDAQQDRRPGGRRRRLHPEAQEPRRRPGDVRPDPGAPADRRPPRRGRRAEPPAGGGAQEADLRARSGPQGPVRPDAPPPQAPRGLAGGRPLHARPISSAATSTTSTGSRTTGWASWWPTCRDMASTRPCSRGWSRPWPPRSRSPCSSPASCWRGWTSPPSSISPRAISAPAST